MRWGRPTKNNKKHRDPRYFLAEGAYARDDEWPADKTQDAMMGRASNLAQQGMERAMGGEVPPWEEDQEGDGFTDATLDEADFDVLRSVLTQCQQSQTGGGLAQQFSEIMSKLGIDLGAGGMPEDEL